jgi:uncharacterized membrane protein
MKVLCTDHVDIAMPAEKVFSFITDLTRWPVWFAPVVSAQHPRSLPIALDEEVHLCLHAGRRRWHETFEVTRFVRNAFLTFEGTFSAARLIDFRVEQRGAMTRLSCGIGYPVFGGAIAAMIDAAFRRGRVRMEVRDSLMRLKGLLDEQAETRMIDDDLFGDIPALPEEPAATEPSARIEEPAAAM